MAKGGQIHVVVDEKQKERWQEEVEDSKRYDTLSELIRTSVEKELSGEGSDATESPALSSDVQELVDDVKQIRQDVSWLKERERDETDISEVAQDVFSALHPLPQGELGEGADADPEEYAATLVIEEHGPQTISAISDELDYDISRVEDAIDYLEEQFMPVKEVEVQNQRHYFKEE